MKMVEHTSDRYSGRTSCGRPLCRPDPDLVAKLNNYDGLLAALDESLTYLPTCEDDGCGPKFPYIPKCPYMKARAVIAEAKEN